MFSEENDILQSLKSFPANDAYFISPKEYFLRGFEYYKQGRLESFAWGKDHAVLTAYVRGTRRYTVEVFSEKGELLFSCDCPVWTPSSHCKHVICTLLTVLNLVSPNLFQVPGQTPDRRRFLEAGLLRAQPAPGGQAETKKQSPGCEIVIDHRQGSPSLFVRRDGESLRGTWGVPRELAFFITYASYASPYLQAHFSQYLSLHRNRHPFMLTTEEGECPIQWDPSLKYQGKTELNIAGDHVEIRTVCYLNGVACGKVHRFWNFVVDLESRRFGMVKDTAGWTLYRDLYAFFHPPRFPDGTDDIDEGWDTLSERDHGPFNGHDEDQGFFRIPLRRFQAFPFHFSKGLREERLNDVLLKIRGETAPLFPSEHTYRLTVEPGEMDADRVILRAECRLGGSRGSPTVPPFLFFTILENHRGLPTLLKAQKRKAVLYPLFLKLLSIRKKTAVDQMIREGLAEGDFHKYAVKAEARGILKHFYSVSAEADARIRFHDGRWFLVPDDIPKETLLYRIPCDLFGPEIFRGMRHHDEMSVPAASLHERLSLLYSRLKEAGIELYYKNKTIVASRWDFAFDARRTTGIDWFEIRPEITCDGLPVDDRVWQAALRSHGVLEKGDTVQILDAGSQEILKALSAIYGAGARKGAGKGEKKEIVRVPRLQILDWVALRRQGVRVKLSEEDETLIERLTRFEKIEGTPLPGKLKAKLRPYQKEGYDWLVFLYRHRFGACLADDMGLGKTVQAISLLGGIREGKVTPRGERNRDPHLVVLPPSLLFNWENEITRFYPALKLHFYTGKERSTVFKNCDLVLTTYGLVRRDIEKLKRIPFHVIVFDEAQMVKNIYADTTGAVRQLQGYFKVVMTGTPLENHLGEYYALIDLCVPGLLGEYDDFKSKVQQENSPGMDLLIRRTRPFVLRRTKEKILKELPPKTETDIYLELTPGQKALYQQTVEQVRGTIDRAYRDKNSGQAQIIALTAILRLRQICVSPRLLNPEAHEPSPKIVFLVQQLQELMEASHSALVFSQFTSFLDILEPALKDEEIPFLRLDGTTAVRKRKALVEGFQEGDRPAAFLLSLKAGGQGLNLTKASYVFHLDPWWNPAVENQASDRAHRIGQKNKVSVTRILMRHTIEEKMMALKSKKLALYRAIMEGAGEGRQPFSISKSDFDFLLGT